MCNFIMRKETLFMKPWTCLFFWKDILGALPSRPELGYLERSWMITINCICILLLQFTIYTKEHYLLSWSGEVGILLKNLSKVRKANKSRRASKRTFTQKQFSRGMNCHLLMKEKGIRGEEQNSMGPSLTWER